MWDEFVDRIMSIIAKGLAVQSTPEPIASVLIAYMDCVTLQ